MSYPVSFGTVNKRVNSTKNIYTPQFTANCNIKEPCDFYNPVFTCQGNFPETANYMYASTVGFGGKYYWITGISFVMGHWEISGKCDVLATYRDAIGTQGFYLARSSAAPLSNIADPYVVVESTPVSNRLIDAMGFSPTGSYIICCAGTTGNRFYMLSEASWQQLYASVFSSGFLQDYKTFWDSVVQEINNTVFKPQDYIISAKWVPVNAIGASTQISLGYTNTGIVGNAVGAGQIIFTKEITWNILAHPQSAAVGGFLNSNMYRKLSLALPGYGNMILDSDVAANCPWLHIIAQMDVTGTLTYSIDLQNADGSFIGFHTYVCTDLSTDAGFSTTKSGVSNAVTSVALGAATGGMIGAIAGAGAAVQNLAPQVERASSGGSRSVLAGGANVILSETSYLVKPIDAGRIGRPFCITAAPATYPGYIQCANASAELMAPMVEIEEVNSYLNGGFYYE